MTIPLNEVQCPTMGQLKDEARSFEKRAEILDHELAPKRENARKEKEAAAKIVAKISAEAEKMTAEFSATLLKIEDEEIAAENAKNLKLEDVQAGKLSMQEYMAGATSGVELMAKALAAAAAKTKDLRRLVREKNVELLAAEIKELEAENEIFYLSSAGGMFWLSSLKEFLKYAETKISATMGGWPTMRVKLDTKRGQLQNAQKHSVLRRAERWSDLDEAGLRGLRLNPLFPEEYLQNLNQAIQTVAGTDKTFTVEVIYYGSKEGIEIW